MKRSEEMPGHVFGYIYGSNSALQQADIDRCTENNGYASLEFHEEIEFFGDRTDWKNRAVWFEMLQRVHPGQTIIIEKMDHLGPKFMQDYIIEDLKQRNVKLISATEPDIYSDPTRVLARQEMRAIVRYNRILIEQARIELAAEASADD